MNIDKVFLSKAIEEVYKTSILDSDKEMKTKVYEVLNSGVFTESEKVFQYKNLDYIDSMYKIKEYVCYIDGAVNSQSQEVSASVSFVVYLDEEEYYKHSYVIPKELSVNETTQNTSSHMAEYQALIILLRSLANKILDPKSAKIVVYTDSEVLKGQYYAEYRVTSEIQKGLRREVFELAKNFEDVIVKWIPRDENQLANDLAQEMIWIE